MTLQELVRILNPIVENKYTRYKKRDIKWAFNEESFYNGENDRRSITIRYVNKSWDTIGFVEMADMHIKQIHIYDTTPVNIVMNLKESLPEEVSWDLVKRQ